MSEVNDVIVRLNDLKREKKDIEEAIAATEQWLVTQMPDSLAFNQGDIRFIAKVVRPKRSTIDAKKLAELYPAAFGMCSVPAVDRERYVAAVASGYITPDMHNEVCAEQNGKPYVRVTVLDVDWNENDQF